MRIHLVAPTRGEAAAVAGKSGLFPPLSLAILAALTPDDVEVRLTDENASPIDWDEPVDLVGITSLTTTSGRAYEIADAFRARGARVVLGGMHASALPAEAAQHADAVAVGEGEFIWPQIVADARAGRLQPRYQAERHHDLAHLPLPRRDLFQRQRYLLPDTLYTTRGCPYGCSFCSVTSFWGRSYRARPVEDVLAEVEAMGRPRLLAFLDDNVAAIPPRAKQLFRALAPYKLSWLGQADLTIARDEELLAALAAGGCKFLLIGIESLSEANLRALGKRTNAVAAYEEAIKRIQGHGIGVFGAFMVGLDDDSEEVFENTLRFAERVRLKGAQFNIPTPWPGTPLHAAVAQEGRLLSTDWARYSSDHVLIAPRRLSAERLQEGHDRLWRQFYSYSSAWRRLGLTGPNLLLSWLVTTYYMENRLSRLLLGALFPLAARVFKA
ncbi:MAG: B12-binding domain-containing radical SAM protein [Chloroflexota bacterium]